MAPEIWLSIWIVVGHTNGGGEVAIHPSKAECVRVLTEQLYYDRKGYCVKVNDAVMVTAEGDH